MRRINLPEIGEQLPLFKCMVSAIKSYGRYWSVIYPIICIHVCVYIYPQPWPPNKIQIVILIINSSLFVFLLFKSCKLLIFMSVKPGFFLGEFPHDPRRCPPRGYRQRRSNEAPLPCAAATPAWPDAGGGGGGAEILRQGLLSESVRKLGIPLVI